MPNEKTLTFTYVGTSPFQGALAQMLREEGVAVQFEAPLEQRSAGDVALTVRTAFEVVGDLSLIWAAVSKFKKRFPGRGDVEGLPDDPDDPNRPGGDIED